MPAPAPVPAPVPAPQPAVQPGLGEEAGAAARIVSLVNQERSAAGMSTLASRSQLAVIAAGHSRAMAERGEIFHNSSYFSAATRKSLGARLLGENVAMNGSADDAHRRLMASPGHRANILNASFDAIGLAVVRDGSGTLYVTQNFMASTTAAAPASASAPRAAAPSRAAVPSPAAPVRAAVPVSVASVATAPAGAAPSPTPTATPTTPGHSTPAEVPGPAKSQTQLALGALSGLLAGAVALASWFVHNGWAL